MRCLRFVKFETILYTLLILCNNIVIEAISRLSNSHVATFLHVALTSVLIGKYIHDMYKMSKICKVYRCEFVLMGDPSTWTRYEGAKVIANWTLRHVTKGRLKLIHYLIEMDLRYMCGPGRCTICGREGHSHSRCPQHAGPRFAEGQ
ncbi:hypothetical protein Ahy_A05g024599 [Arachis hypogaea]|uniref:CCHC-type domain-containing protein n=1 Tax=Arachis hypogaea TaxID=3818 RepID=A0A445D6G2_ARAHY|nr:hypothetical protein Ahy_A05g024599 [Arachis hypogaea]